MSPANEPPIYPRSYLLSLNCGCIKRVLSETAPVSGQTVYCVRHRRPVEVSGVDTEYGMRCLDCRSSRLFGRAKLQAQLYADQHSRKKPTHRIQIRDGEKVIEIRSPKRNLQELKFPVDKPPF